jgi:quercetin dioxygenase-like cupin family protein
MDAFDLADLLTAHREAGQPYHEFLRAESASLSVGLYVLPAGGTDGQRPHAEDEVYYVVSGRARFRAGEDDRPVAAGAVLFVAAGIDHRFHEITEDLTLLVFFAPAESG